MKITLLILTLSLSFISIKAETLSSELPLGRVKCVDGNYNSLVLNLEIYESPYKYVEIKSFSYDRDTGCNGVCFDLENYLPTPFVMLLSIKRGSDEKYGVFYGHERIENNAVQKFNRIEFSFNTKVDEKGNFGGVIVSGSKRVHLTRDAEFKPGFSGLLWLKCSYL